MAGHVTSYSLFGFALLSLRADAVCKLLQADSFRVRSSHLSLSMAGRYWNDNAGGLWLQSYFLSSFTLQTVAVSMVDADFRRKTFSRGSGDSECCDAGDVFLLCGAASLQL
ncbi:unnamed protein product [Symbiodinium natans]|uniref:Secreted protein n=1 Tax=Symbiodinium natans TaxID=878477 RepID=A0A812ID16_9DINO|nr:unnamed protein product [Symbiodinium natans]